MNIYETTHRAKCPNGKLLDFYQINVSSPTMIQVEGIQKALDSLPEVLFQEDLADALRASLGAAVTVIGYHYNIKVTCHRP